MYDVVLVDDEQFILKGLIQVFPWTRYDLRVVGTAADGREGIALVRRLKPHILLTDIRMPQMDGLSMAAALKSEFPNMQIAILTAFRDFDYAQQAIRLGVSRYLLKPSNMDELNEAFAVMIAALKSDERVEEAQEQSAASSFVVSAALSYIQAHFKEKLTLCEVADNIYVSQWHLSKLIHAQLNKGFFDVLNDVRIERAKELLKNPALSATQVAFEVGYGDAAQFSRSFKKVTGATPMAYRAGL